jgi:hypothetical protein
VEGATVTFTLVQTATGPGASFLGGASQVTATTDAAGRATSPTVRANDVAGRFAATASTSGAAPVGYSLRNLAARPVAVAAGAATGESTRAGSRFPIRLAVTVTDADGNPVGGALVTFAAPTHGPSCRFRANGSRKRRVVRVRTDDKGIAIAPPAVANAQPGGYAVTASVGGARHHATFALVNTR